MGWIDTKRNQTLTIDSRTARTARASRGTVYHFGEGSNSDIGGMQRAVFPYHCIRQWVRLNSTRANSLLFYFLSVQKVQKRAASEGIYQL